MDSGVRVRQLTEAAPRSTDVLQAARGGVSLVVFEGHIHQSDPEAIPAARAHQHVATIWVAGVIRQLRLHLIGRGLFIGGGVGH